MTSFTTRTVSWLVALCLAALAAADPLPDNYRPGVDRHHLTRPAPFAQTRPVHVGTQPLLLRSVREAQGQQQPSISTLPEDTFDIKAPETDEVGPQPADRTSREVREQGAPLPTGPLIRPGVLPPGLGGVRPKRWAQRHGGTGGYHPIQTLPGHIHGPQIQPLPGNHPEGRPGYHPIQTLPGHIHGPQIQPLPGNHPEGRPGYHPIQPY